MNSKISILNIIKQAIFRGEDLDDTKVFQQGRFRSNGKTSKFIMMSTYGICSMPPKGGHILMFNSQGRESSRFGFVNDFVRRMRGMKEFEVALLNTKTGKYIYLKNDGSVEVNSDLNITGDLTVVGAISATGDVVAGSGDTIPISLKDHIHTGVEPGAGDSGPPKNTA